MNMTPSELRSKEGEIADSDLTSLSSLVLTDGETAIELVETLETEDETTDPERMAARQQAKERFRLAFEKLSPREREIAILLYLKEMTLREIGEVIGVSESRVSQIHKQLKGRIRELLEDEASLFTEAA